MHFNDLHLLSTCYSFTGVKVSQFNRYIVHIGIWLEHYGMLNLRSYISKTIHLIAMKFTDVT